MQKLEWAVSEQEQIEEINSLQEIIKYEKFFFVVDFFNNNIEKVNGLGRWLGYEDHDFTLHKYYEIIHPSQFEYLKHLAETSLKIVNSKEFNVAFRQHQYVIDIALKHSAGHYVLCKRSLSAWQWLYNNEKQNITHYMNEFTVVNPHIEETSPKVNPRILDIDGNKLFDLEKILKQNSIDVIENKKIFSVQERRILRKFAYIPDVTSSEIAKSFKTQVTTIHTLNKRIIEKGKKFFNDNSISSVKELSTILRRNFIV